MSTQTLPEQSLIAVPFETPAEPMVRRRSTGWTGLIGRQQEGEELEALRSGGPRVPALGGTREVTAVGTGPGLRRPQCRPGPASVTIGPMPEPTAAHGRAQELRALRELVDRAGERGGGAVLRGEPGIGKTFLLDAARARAEETGTRVLSTVGVQSETGLPFSGLHQLLRPLLDGPQALSDPLLAAFGMTDAAGADSGAVAPAVLALLAEAAADAPLLLLVDDAHWLDRPTGEVLAFVASRLGTARVVLLTALRVGRASPLLHAGLDDMPLSGLDAASAHALLTEHHPALPFHTRRRVVQAAAGNPLVLLELPTALAAAAPVPGPPFAALPSTARLRRAFLPELVGLSAATRAVLLAAAVDDSDDLAEILGAASAVHGSELTAAALEPALRAHLLAVSGTPPVVGFRHALLRSAVLWAAVPIEAQRNHAALAALLPDQPDRRIWHRAGATTRPDRELADELGRVAARAHGRGAMAMALAALQRAAQLTADRAERGRRLLSAAALAYDLGESELARSLRVDAESMPLRLADRSQAVWLRVVFNQDRPAEIDGLPGLTALVEQNLQAGDGPRAQQMLLLIARLCWSVEATSGLRQTVDDAVARLGVDSDDVALTTLTALMTPVTRGAEVAARLADWDPVGRSQGELWLASIAAFAVGEFALSGELNRATSDGLRRQGHVGPLVPALVLRAQSCAYTGDMAVGTEAAAEAYRLAEATEQPVWCASSYLATADVAAIRGDVATAEDMVDRAARMAHASHNRALVNGALHARGLAAFADEQYMAAFELMAQMFDPGDPAYHPVRRYWILPFVSECAVLSGEAARGRALLAGLTPAPGVVLAPETRCGMLYAEAVLAEDEVAAEAFRAAFDGGVPELPFLGARLQLAHGAWLRRHGRSLDSHGPLRAALSTFERLGTKPWAIRVGRELEAAGVAEVDPGAAFAGEGWEVLSPRERQIARMAAEGFGNREIGQRLNLSPRTVGTYLYRIFPKLGIGSRRQLPSVLGADDGGDRPGADRRVVPLTGPP